MVLTVVLSPVELVLSLEQQVEQLCDRPPTDVDVPQPQ